MSGRIGAVVAIVILAMVLFIAVKWQVIGGGGATSNRRENAFNYWFGMWFSTAMLFLMIFVLIGSYVQPDHFHLD